MFVFMSEEVFNLARLQDRYELDYILGSGGCAKVYCAKDLKTDQNVALKIADPGLSGNRIELTHALQESKIWSRLHHETIPEIYAYGLTRINSKRIHYISMELVNAQNLTDLIESGRVSNLSDLEINKFLHSAAKTLAYAHKQGIIHGDIKPGNILCLDTESMDKIKLID